MHPLRIIPRLELFFFDDHIAALLGGRLPTRTDLPACRGMLSGSASTKASLCFSPPDNLWSQGAGDPGDARMGGSQRAHHGGAGRPVVMAINHRPITECAAE
jgi:hypothetical protein